MIMLTGHKLTMPVQRFTHSDQLVALVGVEPQLHQSGQSAGQARMSKRGAPYLRRDLARRLDCLTP
jgi:transposase